jgi:uncharacterized protein with von Willebrand factor type A (vWA) domain
MPVKKVVKDLGEMELAILTDDPIIESDNELEAKPEPKMVNPNKKRIYTVKPKDPDAVKKPRTEAQKATWAIVLEKRQKIRDERMGIAKEEKALYAKHVESVKTKNKKMIEDKVVRKAVAIKKRAIKTADVLDEIEDDDTPIEEIQKLVKERRSTRINVPVNIKPVDIKPQIRFY